jgi:uroporphyrinogen-III synthase
VAERPLAGLRVVVTRPRGTGARLVAELERLGAKAAEVPLVAIEPVDVAGLDDALRGDVDWVVVTSANAVRALGDRLSRLAGARFAAVGPATARALRERGIEPAFVPERFAAQAVAAGLGSLEGCRVLLPQADIASPELADELRARGALVEAVVAYRTVPIAPDAEGLAALRRADAILLASGSAARSLAALDLPLEETALVCIGAATAREAEVAGLQVRSVAEESTGEGMIRALVSTFGGRA